jgi:hypothetical protein
MVSQKSSVIYAEERVESENKKTRALTVHSEQ